MNELQWGRVLAAGVVASLGLVAPGTASATMAGWFDCVVETTEAWEAGGGTVSADEFAFVQDGCAEIHLNSMAGDVVGVGVDLYPWLTTETVLAVPILENQGAIFDLQRIVKASGEGFKEGQALQDGRLEALEKASKAVEELRAVVAAQARLLETYQAKDAEQQRQIAELAAGLAAVQEQVAAIAELKVISAQLEDQKVKIRAIEEQITR